MPNSEVNLRYRHSSLEKLGAINAASFPVEVTLPAQSKLLQAWADFDGIDEAGLSRWLDPVPVLLQHGLSENLVLLVGESSEIVGEVYIVEGAGLEWSRVLLRCRARSRWLAGRSMSLRGQSPSRKRSATSSRLIRPSRRASTLADLAGAFHDSLFGFSLDSTRTAVLGRLRSRHRWTNRRNGL
jgi:hypothetical protein